MNKQMNKQVQELESTETLEEKHLLMSVKKYFFKKK